MKPIEELVLPTQDEILAKLKSREQGDPFGFETNEYLNYLDFEHAKAYLKEDVTTDIWEKSRPAHTREAVIEAMKKYHDFAWEKANNCRGISANRSIMHYIAWLFVVGDLELHAEIAEDFRSNYQFYGKPILIKIAERYGWDWKKLDNGKRTNTEDV